MPKLKLLILDAGVVIHLHELQLWQPLLVSCDVHLSRIVAEREVLFEPNEDGGYGDDIDLRPDVSAGRINVFEVTASDVKRFRESFDSLYIGDLDDGESESLAFLAAQTDEYLISSRDAIVYRVLGNLGRGDQGISLEEALNQIGLGREIKWPFNKLFRDKFTRLGTEDLIRGRGKKR
ncbi:MAG: hypothetical protein DWI02_11295 [Planctomycetota bacterium]|nr:MAG: hypothetical protein DWI02_11295 [Planctomycetota bacterium]